MRLKVWKLEIMTHFHLIDDDGEVMDETSAQPIAMYPKKFIPFEQFVKEAEINANSQEENIKKLAERKSW